MNGVQTRFKCKLDVKRCKRFVFPPSSLLPRSNALKTKAIRYFQTDRTLTRIVSPPLSATIGEEAHRRGLPNEMNYVMDYRLIHCLRNGLPLDMDVYDAAEWSCITELSEKSVLNKSMAVEIPDFTRGAWKKYKY